MIEKVSTPIAVFLPYFVETRLADYLKFAAGLRSKGIGVELYPETKKLGQQLKYADKRGYRVAVIIGEDEFQRDTCQIKDLKTGQSVECPQTECANLIPLH
ncbi:MAG: hypothetical protein LBQ50_02090 [Planctomycetaceae bacterium]|nr:hypothetical protein [Planctomycetaceae bacterium]